MSLLAGAQGAEAVAFNRQDIHVDADGVLAWRGVRHRAIDPARDPRAPALHRAGGGGTARCPGCAASWASTSSGTQRAGRWRSR